MDNENYLSVIEFARSNRHCEIIPPSRYKGLGVRTKEPARFIVDAKSQGVDVNAAEFEFENDHVIVRFPNLTSDDLHDWKNRTI